MSGSALSPFTVGLSYGKDLAKKFAERFKCPTEPPSGMLQCLRQLPLQYFLDSDVLRDRISRFPMMFGVTKAELLPTLSENDAIYGLETEKRREVLKEFIDGFYSSGYRSEILAAAIHEYTDWERPIQHPISIVAPMVKVGELHSNTKTYFYVFEYQSKTSDYVQRLGCVPGEDLSYVFGVPLYLSNLEHLEWEQEQVKSSGPPTSSSPASTRSTPDRLGIFVGNYTRNEFQLSHTLLHYWANFIKTGNPNLELSTLSGTASESEGSGSVSQGFALSSSNVGENRFSHQDKSSSPTTTFVKPKLMEWPAYDSLSRKYLSIEAKPRTRSNYRAHKLSFWNQLIPELMRATGAGGVFSSSNYPTNIINSSNSSTSQHPPSIQLVGPPYWEQHPFYYSSNYSGGGGVYPLGSRPNYPYTGGGGGGDGFQIYSTALSVTIAVGCSLLILNILVFAAFYYFRDKRRSAAAAAPGAAHLSPQLQCSGESGGSVPINYDPHPTTYQSDSGRTSVYVGAVGVEHNALPSLHNPSASPTTYYKENGQVVNLLEDSRAIAPQVLQQGQQPMPNVCGDLPMSSLQHLLGRSTATTCSGSGSGGVPQPYPTNPISPTNASNSHKRRASGGGLQNNFELSMPDAILAAAMMLNYRQSNSSQAQQQGGRDFSYGPMTLAHNKSNKRGGAAAAAAQSPALNNKEQLLVCGGGANGLAGAGPLPPPEEMLNYYVECGKNTVPRPPKRHTPTVKFSPDTFIPTTSPSSVLPDGSICYNASNMTLSHSSAAGNPIANATPTPTSTSSLSSTNSTQQLKSSLKKHSNYSQNQDGMNV